VNSLTDQQLLRDYVNQRSEAAFAELVRRHVNLVYSAALRMVCDAHQAEDVTQAVFAALALSAEGLKEHPVLSGWLHRTAQNIAAQTVRTDVRRRAREQEATAMNELPQPAATWEHIAPHLDLALGQLSGAERDAVLLRYFERRSAREMAQILNTSEEAAQKRVSRAVARLRDLFAKRGITIGTSGLIVVISANAVQVAPAGLAVTISTTAVLSGTTVVATATTTAVKAIAMTTIQKTLITATILAFLGTAMYEGRRAASSRAQVQTLQKGQAALAEHVRQLITENESLSNRVAKANRSPSLSSERLRELLRLRGEVGVLRRQQREAAEAAAAQSNGLPGQRTSIVNHQSNAPAPFQVQLVLDKPGENTEAITNSASGPDGESLALQKTPLLDYTAISSATVTTNISSGVPQIDIEFSQVGKELFAAITKENLNKRLAIVLDGQVVSTPIIRSEISEGKAQITGSFTEDEARKLAAKINEAISPAESK